MTAVRTTPFDPEVPRERSAPTRDYEGPPSDHGPDPQRPVVIGSCLFGTPYRIERRIGEGGMGVVYEATHLDLDRRVALKLLRPSYSGDMGATERFAKEARAVCKLDSPYAVDVYDFERLPDGRAFLAMELLEGTTLAELLAEGPVDVEQALGLLRQVCKGLGAAHEAGIVHRDVKPENIAILEGEGGRSAVKILDFGIHAVLSPEEGTADARAAGTPAYQSPEACASLPVDVRSDIYSLGVTAYEMLAGRLPFDVDDDDGLLLAHLHDPIVPMSRVASWVPRSLAEVIERCLEKSPADRYADTADLEAALCEAQVAARVRTSWDDLPLPDVDEERLGVLRRRIGVASSQRRWWSWALVAFVVVTIAVAAIVWAVPSAATQSEVTTLTNRARAAAARAYYVYPPPDNPGEQTAYRVVLDLEDLGWVGRDRAKDLRTEFADALARLGDRYWDEPGGRPFAADFYAEALIFEPSHERASARATVTAGQIATIRDKAATATFNEGELAAAETLSVLAEEDDRERDRRLAALLASKRVRSVTVDAHLEQIASDEAIDARDELRARAEGERKRAAPVVPRASGRPAEEVAEERPDDDVAEEESSSGEEPESSPPEETDTARDEAEVAKQLADARKDLAKSRYAVAVRGFEAVLAADPRNAAAMEGLAQASFERGAYDVAARFAAKAVARRPRVARLHMLLGDAYYKTFRYRKALQAYHEAERLGASSAKRAITKVEARLAERPD